MKFTPSQTIVSSYSIATSVSSTSFLSWKVSGTIFKLSLDSIFLRSFDFSSIMLCCLASIFLARFIIFAALCPTYPLSNLLPELVVPCLLLSTLSDHVDVRFAELESLLISFFNFSFSTSSKPSCNSLVFA